MKHGGILPLLAFLFCLFSLPAAAEGVNRALLVGCDRFVSQEDTTPSSANNVTRVADALSGGEMNLETLVTRRNDLSSVDTLRRLVLETFGAADEGDVSYFYISTHGLWDRGQANSEMQLLLSNGYQEEGVTAAQLREIFDQIQGTKVLIVDACSSGAMIGKGVNPPFDNAFASPDYKVLCSSGGAEESWFWSGMEDGSSGAGYFSDALVSALSYRGSFGADSNRDGAITLTELKRYLLLNHGASTPQTYPEEDDFVVLRYDVEAVTGRRRGATIEGLTFADEVLTGEEPGVDFSFTVLRTARVAYQVVFQRKGRWDFDNGRLLWDNAERFGEYGDALGYLSPGYKERTLSFTRKDTGSYGYVLLQMLSMSDNSAPSLISSRVLAVPPIQGDPLLEVIAAESFCPAQYGELNLVVHHQYPCELQVVIEDMAGNVVRRLSSRQATRPQQLKPLGSTFCWNGRQNDGSLASEGFYRARITGWIGDASYETLSSPFLLAASQG